MIHYFSVCLISIGCTRILINSRREYIMKNNIFKAGYQQDEKDCFIEEYSDERVQEFMEEDSLDKVTADKMKAFNGA